MAGEYSEGCEKHTYNDKYKKYKIGCIFLVLTIISGLVLHSMLPVVHKETNKCNYINLYNTHNGNGKHYYICDNNILAEGNLKNNNKIGRWIYYDDYNQYIRESYYINGIPIDNQKRWNYDNGKLISVGFCEDGKKVGMWEYYDKDNLVARGSYEADKRVKIWQYWNDEGKVSEINYNV